MACKRKYARTRSNSIPAVLKLCRPPPRQKLPPTAVGYQKCKTEDRVGMSKAQDSKKESKKEPAKSTKEKKEAKKAKKEERARQ